jgi:hypothetical protein
VFADPTQQFPNLLKEESVEIIQFGSPELGAFRNLVILGEVGLGLSDLPGSKHI